VGDRDRGARAEYGKAGEKSPSIERKTQLTHLDAPVCAALLASHHQTFGKAGSA
jgi:hypothetical protein